MDLVAQLAALLLLLLAGLGALRHGLRAERRRRKGE